jgi:hypothetical protein
VDSAVGKVLNALYARPTYANEDWLILVITDHGGTGFGHGANSNAERYIWWIASGNAVAHQQITKADPGTYSCNNSSVFDSSCVDLSLLKQSPVHADITVSALHHLIYNSGINPETKADWSLDGKSWLLLPTNTKENGGEETFTVYPIPASDHIVVNSLPLASKDIPVEIFSADGKKVFTAVPNATELHISIGQFSNGIYFLKVGNSLKHFSIAK